MSSAIAGSVNAREEQRFTMLQKVLVYAAISVSLVFAAVIIGALLVFMGWVLERSVGCIESPARLSMACLFGL